MAKKKQKIADKMDLVFTALEMASSRPWDSITMRDLADETGVSLADLHAHFADKTDILCAFGRYIDQQILENLDEGMDDVSVRDRLFDILMDRFDLLNDYRVGLISILNSFVPDPKQAVISAPHLCRSMSWMLEAAGADTNGLRGALKVSGLTALYLNVLRTWKRDESADLAKTMAALDKHLERSERFVNMFAL